MILQRNSCSIAPINGEMYTSQLYLQPISFKSDRLLGCCSSRDKVIFPPFRLVFFCIEYSDSAVAICVATFLWVSNFY